MLCGGGGTGADALTALKAARAAAGRGGDTAQIASSLDGALATTSGGGSGGDDGGARAEEMVALQGMLEDTGSRGVQLGSGLVEGVTLAKKMALTNSKLREARYSYRRLVRTRACAHAPVHALTRARTHSSPVHACACDSRLQVREMHRRPAWYTRPCPGLGRTHGHRMQAPRGSPASQYTCMRAQAFDALSTQHEEALRTHAALMHENGGLREKMTLLELALASRLFKRARWCTACHQGRMGREASGLGCSTHSGRAPQPLRQAVAARVQPSACAMPRISLIPRLLPPQAVKRVRYFTSRTSLAHRPWSRTPARHPRRSPCSARTPSVRHAGLEPRTSRP